MDEGPAGPISLSVGRSTDLLRQAMLTHRDSHILAGARDGLARERALALVSDCYDVTTPSEWVVTNGEVGRDLAYRMWSGRAWVWTSSLAQAVRFARRSDAQSILPDGDDHGQRVTIIRDMVGTPR